VLQDAHQPGLQLRLLLKRLGPAQGRQHRLGDRVLGPGLVAQLQPRELEQVGPVFGQLVFETHGRSVLKWHGMQSTERLAKNSAIL